MPSNHDIVNRYKYRYMPEIDGLRAIAVISVILFHFQVNHLSGGFVGVDIFFVISGYLITGLLMKNIVEGSGSVDLADFYMKRIRRLFPALLVVITVSFFCAYLLFDPKNMQRFSGASVYALVSASNFYFLFESGYFEANAYVKPLLHTWSLGVEEQFYLIWPVLLTLFWRRAGLFVLSVSVLSLVLCLYFIESYSSATFFMMPFRIYEFGIGASLLWLSAIKSPRVLNELLGVTGLLLIALSIVLLDEGSIFPGINALCPCIGAALLIYAKDSAITGSLLRSRLFVHFGLISYSLYLVHWPLVVFYKSFNHSSFDVLSVSATLSLLAATYILAWLLHRHVESRFRYAPETTRKSVFGITCTSITLVLATVAATAWMQSGWPWRFSSVPENLRSQMTFPDEIYTSYAYKKIREIEKPFADNDQRKVLVIGDSQAGDFVNMLYEIGAQEKIDLKSILIGAKCQPLLIEDSLIEKKIPPKYRHSCAAERRRYARSDRIAKADTIIIAASWRAWAVSLLPKTLAKLSESTKASITVLGLKTQGRNGQALIAEHKMRSGLGLLSASYLNPDIEEKNSALEKAAVGHQYLDLMGIICPNPYYCRVLTDNSEVIFFDENHVTPNGARFLGTLMKKQGMLDNILVP